jgi:hypothetical protein
LGKAGNGANLVQAAEAVVRRLHGVQAVRIETDQAGGIQFIHVLGGPDRSPRVIASDIVSALAADLGVELEPRQVRVAAQQRAADDVLSPQSRLKFVGLAVSVMRTTAEVKVHLESQGLVYEGIATGAYANRNRLELVAEATLRAVEVFLRAEGMFALEGVRVVQIGTHEVAVAVVTLAGRDEETLTGSCPVRDDPREAVVRAVLDTLNRPVSWIAGT